MRIRIKTALAGCASWWAVAPRRPTSDAGGRAVTVDNGHGRHDAKTKHVLLLSIDGMHDFDLTNYVAAHPTSALASLVARGTVYTQAYATAPSDSFPATLAITTGGSPRRRASTTTRSGTTTCRRRDRPARRAARWSRTRRTSTSPPRGSRWRGHQPGDAAARSRQRLRAGVSAPVPAREHDLRGDSQRRPAHRGVDKHPAYEMLCGPRARASTTSTAPSSTAAKKDIAKIIANDELKVTAVLTRSTASTTPAPRRWACRRFSA